MGQGSVQRGSYEVARRSSLVKASNQMTLFVNSCVHVRPELIPLGTSEYEIDSRAVNAQGENYL
jgi:hypothetical protein